MFYSENKKQYSVLNRRTFLLYLFKVSFFGIVGWRLYDIQIKDSQKYKTLSKNNQIDVEIIYPIRGKIYDTKTQAAIDKDWGGHIIPPRGKLTRRNSWVWGKEDENVLHKIYLARSSGKSFEIDTQLVYKRRK